MRQKFGGHSHSTKRTRWSPTLLNSSKTCLTWCRTLLRESGRTPSTSRYMGRHGPGSSKPSVGTVLERSAFIRLLTSGPDEFLEAMVRGWLDGDGWRYDRVRQYEAGVSISHDLALSMYQISVGLGRSPVIQWQKPTLNSAAKTRQPRWTVCFATTGDNWRMQSDGEYMWRKVRLIEKEVCCGPVYDLGVAENGSYIAEGIGVGSSPVSVRTA